MNVLSRIARPATLACAVAGAAAAQAAAGSCQATAPATAPTVVELYTSEGCSSCPPADRWLSTLKGRPDVLALAFHVNYWDRLGWTDRFATTETTARQHLLAQQAGSQQVYTPQVVVDGRDARPGAALPRPAGPAAVEVTLAREGDTVTAQIAAPTGARGSFEGYWAVLEDGHQSQVRAGENAGETLRHDHVVRLYRPVPAWAAGAGSRQQITVSRGTAEFPRRVVFVVTDAASHKPVQAASLGC